MIYRRYASLYFVCGVTAGENELNALEVVYRYVESLDNHFGNARLSSALLHSILLKSSSILPRSLSLTCEPTGLLPHFSRGHR